MTRYDHDQATKSANLGIIVLVIVVLSSYLFFYLVISYFEMKAFNKFSTKQASYVDALVSELRITPQ